MTEAAPQFAHLLEVQDVDTALDQLRHRKEKMPERAELADVQARMAAIEARTKDVRAERDDYGTRQSALEAQIEAARARRTELEKRMYGGQIAAARDLKAMDDEVKHLARHVGDLEDREIEIMEVLEPLDQTLGEADAERHALEENAARLRQNIAEAVVEIDDAIASQTKARLVAAHDVPADLLARYEQLRTRLGGTGAARLVGVSCGGCHLALPAMEVDRIRKAPADAVITATNVAASWCGDGSPMLVLVRHGESAGNAAGVLLGRTNSPLTDRGQAQAAAVAGLLGPFNRVISSPLGRALDTAAALAGDVAVEVDERWVEVDYGQYDGEALGAVPAEVWLRWRSDAAFCPPGGESLAEVGTRVRAACEELFASPGEGARSDDGDVVVVSHVSPIKAAVAWALGTGDGTAWRLYLATASVTTIGWGSDAAVLHGYNLVSR